MINKRIGVLSVFAALVAVFYLSSEKHDPLSSQDGDCEPPKIIPESNGTTQVALSEPEISDVNHYIAHAGGSIQPRPAGRHLAALGSERPNRVPLSIRTRGAKGLCRRLES